MRRWLFVAGFAIACKQPCGSEVAPGTGSATNPDTGRYMDDIAPMIKGFDWLSAADKKAIFEDNAKKLFKLDTVKPRL